MQSQLLHHHIHSITALEDTRFSNGRNIENNESLKQVTNGKDEKTWFKDFELLTIYWENTNLQILS